LQQAQGPFAYAQPPIVIADPQAQGGAEAFCSALKRLARGRPVFLYSDSVDASFVSSMGLRWLRKSKLGSDEVLAAVRSAIVNVVRQELP
jgi:hypothetical protein